MFSMIEILKTYRLNEGQLISVCEAYMQTIQDYSMSLPNFIYEYVDSVLQKDFDRLHQASQEIGKSEYTKLLNKENRKRIDLFDELNHIILSHKENNEEQVKLALQKVIKGVEKVEKILPYSSIQEQTQLLDQFIDEFTALESSLWVLGAGIKFRALKEAQAQFAVTSKKKVKGKNSGVRKQETKEQVKSNLKLFTNIMLAQAMMDKENKHYKLNRAINKITLRYNKEVE